MVSKFSEHLPLYRQQDVLGRHGIFLARSTLCGWMAQCAQLLRPLVELMRQRVVQSDVINADETPVRVLDRTRNSCASAEPHLAGHVTIVAWPKGGGGEAWRNGCATAARSSTGGRSWHAGDQAGFPCGPTASSIGSRNRLSTGGDARFRGATAPGPDSCRCRVVPDAVALDDGDDDAIEVVLANQRCLRPGRPGWLPTPAPHRSGSAPHKTSFVTMLDPRSR